MPINFLTKRVTIVAYYTIKKLRDHIVKSFIYRGFRIDIHYSTYWRHRYEWVITAVSERAKRICRHAAASRLSFYHRATRGNPLMFIDPTTCRSARASAEFAKIRVNELAYPMCYQLMSMKHYSKYKQNG